MSFGAKTDYSGLARAGLEIVANEQNASNQNLEIVKSNANISSSVNFGSVKNPHVDFKITADFTLNASGATAANKVALGKVHGTSPTVPYALKSLKATSGAGEEPTFGVDLVQIQSGATAAKCVYFLDEESFTPARHASAYGAFTFTESDDLTLQHAELTYDCGLDPTTINGVPKASDAVKGKKIVSVTMWTNSDSTQPAVTVDDDFSQIADWNCTGQDGAMFVWTATFVKYLESSNPVASGGGSV